ncbi:unnamed protein product [Cylindrotheca closterium]|uniref:Uncharacterized protein n=1 Tax=Cylindrotheca closterium TaxID=2856 RepID=A0AAD2JJS3_9STRA|nr:unnamed protein product [Cylindrotheca closterium]
MMFYISLLLIQLALCTGFSVRPSSITNSLVGQGRYSGFPSSSNGLAQFMSTDDNDVTPQRRRRRKKVDTDLTDKVNEDSGESVIANATIDLKPRARAPVTLEVQDVRGLVGGVPSVKSTRNPPPTTKSNAPPTPMASDQSLETSTDGTVPDDSFAQLLEDARRMSDDTGGIGDSGGDGDDTIKAKARNILSTIVTADFFVVFGFLLWFLAGIGFRAVFNDDTVQIAFNNNFELLVQPALGVLMLGTVAGNFLKDEEEED